ncbi:co-chaperone GroES [Paraburkholderia denitrificans]|uniref:Co-chaperonin GroES n=1 Tax=Paraburkholderia denitrificans TaxID=694025 RepID=A0ABW0J4N6_9BURK
MQIRPLYDRVIVKRIETQRTAASGIVIPDSAAEKPEQGEVVAVGNGRLLQDGTLRALQLKAGDQVLFGKYASQTVKVDGEELLVMREEDVMGVLDADATDASAARKAA